MSWLHLVSTAQLQPSNLVSQLFLLFLYSVWWYLKHYSKADKAAVAAYSVEIPIIQKIMTNYSDISFYKISPSLYSLRKICGVSWDAVP